jgi:hypothetical protein
MSNRTALKSTVAFAVVFSLIVFVMLAIVSTQTVFAATNTINAITATVTVQAQCTPIISNTLIFFPQTLPGSFAATANGVNVITSGAPSNIAVYGTNWVSGGNNFFVTNTLWNQVSGQNIGNQLLINGNIPIDTRIPLKAASGNDIYFGVNVPVGQAAGTYTQQIILGLSC